MGGVHPAVDQQARGRGVGRRCEVRAERGDHRTFLRESFVGGTCRVLLAHQGLAHRLGVAAGGVQLGRPRGLDDSVVHPVVGDLAELAAQVVERHEHPAPQQEVCRENETEQRDAREAERCGEASREGAELVARGVACCAHVVVERSRGRRDGGVRPCRGREEGHELDPRERSLLTECDCGIDDGSEPRRRCALDIGSAREQLGIGRHIALHRREVVVGASACGAHRQVGHLVSGDDVGARLGVEAVESDDEIARGLGGR